MNNHINQTIHEWMGKCWHEGWRVRTEDSLPQCAKCNAWFSVGPNPIYTSSLDAVAEAEKKAVLRFGTDEYAWALAAVLKIRMDDYEPIQTQDYVAFALAEPKDRAAAIFNLITENK